MKTIPDDTIGQKRTGYVILALASENAKQQITNLTRELAKELPDTFRTIPSEQLHFTLAEIIQPFRNYELSKNHLFNQFSENYLDTAIQLLENTPSFTINFDTVEASQNAIIVRASDSSRFNSIRGKLLTNVTLPTETRTPPDITHSSIARYIKAVNLEKVQATITKHQINFDEKITEFKLLKTLEPPLKDYKVIKTFRLT